MKCLSESDSGTEIRIKVIPRSAKSEILGETDGLLKIRLNAPPADGAANKELIKLLSKTLGTAKTNLTITRGEKSRVKTVYVNSGSTKEVEDILLASI